MNRILAGREPALLITLLGIAIKLGAMLADLTIDQQSGLNAAVAAAVGLAIAYTTRDGLSAALLGLAQALIALALGFGIHVAADTQALIMAAVATAVGMFTRTQVIAPEPVPPTSPAGETR